MFLNDIPSAKQKAAGTHQVLFFIDRDGLDLSFVQCSIFSDIEKLYRNCRHSENLFYNEVS